MKHTQGTAILAAHKYLLDNYPEVFVFGQGLWSPWYVGSTMTDLDKIFQVIYFLFELIPSLSISFLIAFLISKKIKVKSKNNRKILTIKRSCKFLFESST